MKELKAYDLQKYINKKVDVTFLGKDGFTVDFNSNNYLFSYEEITIKDVVLLNYNSKEQKISFKTKSNKIYTLNPIKIEINE